VVGEGGLLVPTGGVAGFPLPPLRYYVGSATSPGLASFAGGLALVYPAEGSTLEPSADKLVWTEAPGAALSQVEVMDSGGAVVVAALLRAGDATYRLPPFVAAQASQGPLRWRVLALDLEGRQLAATDWGSFVLAVSPAGPPPSEPQP
jgi:hypothetical protein